MSSINTFSSGSRSKDSTGSGEDVWAAAGSEGGVEAMASWILGLVPPLVMVVGTSLIALLLIALILVLLVMKISERSRQQRQEHVSVFYNYNSCTLKRHKTLKKNIL